MIEHEVQKDAHLSLVRLREERVEVVFVRRGDRAAGREQEQHPRDCRHAQRHPAGKTARE